MRQSGWLTGNNVRLSLGFKQAATNTHLDVLQLLHEKGADMEARCLTTSKTPLMRAVRE
jgi:uncharacterized membrane protein (DUF2068 family)